MIVSQYKNNDTAYYDVLEAINDLSNDSLCVLNHLYINEGQEETFEQKFCDVISI